MKTASEYYELHRPAGGAFFHELPNHQQRTISAIVSSVEADARADALAEAKAVTDEDETNEAREWKRFQAIHRELWKSEIDNDTVFHRSFAEYAKTLPPRPMRSPGQRLFESDVAKGYFPNNAKWELASTTMKAEYESRATALGIQPKE